MMEKPFSFDSSNKPILILHHTLFQTATGMSVFVLKGIAFSTDDKPKLRSSNAIFLMR